jgi:hypothetical protein
VKDHAKDHRRFERFNVWLPLHIDSDKKKARVGVTRNMSASGLMFGTRSRYAVGQNLDLTFRVDLRAPERLLRARIVRLDGTDDGGMFPRRVAVEFTEPLPELEPMVQEAAKYQAKLYGLAS